MNSFLGRMSKIFSIKYALNPMGTNIAMPDGNLKLLGLDFQCEKPLTREEARKFLIQIGKDFLREMNNDPALRPHFIVYPVTMENMCITLFLIDSSGVARVHPDLATAAIGYGELWYRSYGAGRIPPMMSEHYETYKEALKLIKR